MFLPLRRVTDKERGRAEDVLRFTGRLISGTSQNLCSWLIKPFFS